MCKFTHRLLVFLFIGVQRLSWAAPTPSNVDENILPLLDFWQEDNDRDEHVDERQFGKINVRFNFDDILVGIPYRDDEDDEYGDSLWPAAAHEDTPMKTTIKPTTGVETKLNDEETIIERNSKPLSKHTKFDKQNKKSRIAFKNLFDGLLARYRVLPLDD